VLRVPCQKGSVLQCAAVCYSVLQCAAVCCSVLHCVAVCCSVLQRECVALCHSILQVLRVRLQKACGFMIRALRLANEVSFLVNEASFLGDVM